MNLSDLQHLFNRALQYTFSAKKLTFVAGILALCGVLVVFCRALAIQAGDWIVLSLTFLPIFLCGGILLASGVVLVRVYHDEVKKRAVSYNQTISKSWQVAISASYFFVPIILVYLLMWMALGIFYLLRQIPSAGQFFGVILAFGPFLINLGSLVLSVLTLALLFFVTPTIALCGTDPVNVSHLIIRRIKGDVFTNCLLIFVALLPLIIVVALLSLAAFLTGSTYVEADDSLHIVLQWFFIMLPFTALLSPAVVFFFNFATEAHVLLKRMQVES